jgi:predicted CXXCH cytochrome family protein
MKRKMRFQVLIFFVPFLFYPAAGHPQDGCISKGCHEDFDKFEVKHPIMEEGCENCHELQSEKDHKFTLVEEGNDLCLMCHDDVVEGERKHGAIEAGGCTICHDPHGSSRKRLLAMAFPEGLYAPWSPDNYELCFSCHEESLVGERSTTEATAFRDGKRNLHSVHVGRETKGRTCLMCHYPHAGSSHALLRESTPFGKWNLSIRWKGSDKGGSCAPSCHKKRSYDRSRSGSDQ